ncbi:pirin family protein [Undibacterium sp.]|jgi:redox-sensitive bicupin YhaK (pirin superfamily)|uniref:pirin family protein n=1 Tax=Undibacterium sp. TaxID=1914977 RepID=UPI002B9831A1|nr:pirin family protein [Undibacterium sp.]HTD04855.1 pirin family protein [Undibacterium sp.]
MNTELADSTLNLSPPLLGIPMKIGDHFFAHSFRRSEIGDVMNPVLMFDHFWMKRDTFGWHPHAGISAVTYVFEDSKSAHHNSDSMGDNSVIDPGSLHWMVAGSGAMHRERPEGEGALVHGLQFFVDLPGESKSARPYSTHLACNHVPEIIEDGSRIRVVAGQFEGIQSPLVLPQPFLMVDVFMGENKTLNIPLPANWGAWLYSVRGEAGVKIEGRTRTLEAFHSIGLRTGAGKRIATIQSELSAQLVILAGVLPKA